MLLQGQGNNVQLSIQGGVPQLSFRLLYRYSTRPPRSRLLLMPYVRFLALKKLL
jgi:hypothetical protein